jgi:hypothetical protein
MSLASKIVDGTDFTYQEIVSEWETLNLLGWLSYTTTANDMEFIEYAQVCTSSSTDIIVINTLNKVVSIRLQQYNNNRIKLESEEFKSLLEDIITVYGKYTTVLVNVNTLTVLYDFNSKKINPEEFTELKAVLYDNNAFLSKAERDKSNIIVEAKGAIFRCAQADIVYIMALKQDYNLLQNGDYIPTDRGGEFILTYEFVKNGGPVEPLPSRHVCFEGKREPLLDKYVSGINAKDISRLGHRDMEKANRAIQPVLIEDKIVDTIKLSAIIDRTCDIDQLMDSKVTRFIVIIDREVGFVIDKAYFEPETRTLVVYTNLQSDYYAQTQLKYSNVILIHKCDLED